MSIEGEAIVINTEVKYIKQPRKIKAFTFNICTINFHIKIKCTIHGTNVRTGRKRIDF